MCRFRYRIGCFDTYSSPHKGSFGWRYGFDRGLAQRCGCHAYPSCNCGGGRRRWIQWMGRNHWIDQNGTSRPRHQDQLCHHHHVDAMTCSNHYRHICSLPTKYQWWLVLLCSCVCVVLDVDQYVGRALCVDRCFLSICLSSNNV